MEIIQKSFSENDEIDSRGISPKFKYVTNFEQKSKIDYEQKLIIAQIIEQNYKIEKIIYLEILKKHSI